MVTVARILISSLSALEQPDLLGFTESFLLLNTALTVFIPPKRYSKEKNIKRMETFEDALMYLREGMLAGS